MATQEPSVIPPGASGFILAVARPKPAAKGEAPQVLREVLFVPLDPDAPCPCGSQEPFGACCQVFGAKQPFMRSPDGGLAPAMVHTESWTDLASADVRARLMAHPDLWCTENNLLRCFWHYRPGGEKGQELFGTIELTADHLELETLSRPRYEALRSVLESVLGPLPIGERQVSTLTGNPDAAAPNTAPLLEEYLSMRKRSRALNRLVVEDLTRDEINEAAKRLRMLDSYGRLDFENTEDLAVLQDFALYEVKRRGQPVITYFLRNHSLAEGEGPSLSQAIARSRVSLFQFDAVTGQGPVVQDLLEPARPPLLVVDLGLARTASPGVALVGRLLPTEQFAMLSGWGFVVQPDHVEQVQRDLLRAVQSESRRARVSSLIRYCRTTLPSMQTGEARV